VLLVQAFIAAGADMLRLFLFVFAVWFGVWAVLVIGTDCICRSLFNIGRASAFGVHRKFVARIVWLRLPN
jgi:hypothetical protein